MPPETPTAPAPETSQPTPAPEATPAPAAAPAAPEGANRTSREEVYRRYYDQGQPAPQAEPPAPQAPAAPDYAAQIAGLNEQITRLQGQLEKATAPPAPPPTPAAEPPDTHWVELLREGKFEEANAFLMQKAEQRIADRVRREAAAEASNRVRVEREIDSYLADVKSKNPEIQPLLVEYEDVIAGRVQGELQRLIAAKKVSNPDEFVTAYKSLVEAEIERARKFIRQIRADGANGARTANEKVLSATTLAPSQLGNRGDAPEGDKIETPADYIARRQAAALARRGLQ